MLESLSEYYVLLIIIIDGHSAADNTICSNATVGLLQF